MLKFKTDWLLEKILKVKFLIKSHRINYIKLKAVDTYIPSLVI